jgi:hypothetical protein
LIVRRWAPGFIAPALCVVALCAAGPARAAGESATAVAMSAAAAGIVDAGAEAAPVAAESERGMEILALGAERDAIRASLGAGGAGGAGGGARRQPPGTTEPRRTLLRRERPNTISVGVQGSYGVVRGTSRLADGFSDGPGYAVRFRYMLSTSFALGFSFENHRYYDRGGEPSPEPGASDSVIVMTTVAIEGVKYLNRASEAHPYFLAGFGYASPDIVEEVLGSARVNEGVFLTGGVGFERFVRSRFSIDITLEGHALISNSELTTFAQICGGIHLYPGD